MKRPVVRSLLSVLLAAVVLFALAFGLNGVANKRAQADHIYIMQTLLPGSTQFTLEPYTGEDANVRSVHKGQTGFVVETTTAGYADEITLLVGVSNEGTVTGLVVKQMHETKGLGMQALSDWQFLKQYLKSSGDAQVDALSGATVTTKAITRCVNSAVAVVTGADAESGATSWGG